LSTNKFSRRYLAHVANESLALMADTIIYRSSQKDCHGCSLKAQCCPNTPFRKIARSLHEGAHDIVRSIMGTAQYQQSCRERKKVEMPFAHLKRIRRLNRLRLRGPTEAHDEFPLAATAQNLRRMANRLYGRELNMAQPAI
jgi:hypothetical protein